MNSPPGQGNLEDSLPQVAHPLAVVRLEVAATPAKSPCGD
jgi:hypothetical protein